MAIQTSELIAYAGVSRPENDSSTAGGAIDATMRLAFTQLTANSIIAFQSSSASDVQSVSVRGRVAGGAIVTETFNLTGVTEKDGAQVFERILWIKLASNAVGTITVKQGAAGATIATVPPGEAGFCVMFIDSASGAAQTIRYGKFFWTNKSAEGKTLTNAILKLSSDPSAKIMIGLATAKNGSSTITNRLTAPAGITFVDDNVDQNVPGTTLEATSTIEVWVKQTLAPNDLPVKSTFTTQLRGSST